jgi:hypothetical protein
MNMTLLFDVVNGEFEPTAFSTFVDFVRVFVVAAEVGVLKDCNCAAALVVECSNWDGIEGVAAAYILAFCVVEGTAAMSSTYNSLSDHSVATNVDGRVVGDSAAALEIATVEKGEGAIAAEELVRVVAFGA